MPRGTRQGRRKRTRKLMPSETKPMQPNNEGYIVSLFADIVGCSEISNHKNLREHNEFVNGFQDCFTRVTMRFLFTKTHTP